MVRLLQKPMRLRLLPALLCLPLLLHLAADAQAILSVTAPVNANEGPEQVAVVAAPAAEP